MTIHEAIKNFIADKAAEGLSLGALKNYECTLTLFGASVGLNKPCEALSWEDVRLYIQSLYDGHIRRETARSYSRNIKIFIKWLDGFCRLPFSYTRIKLPRSSKKNVTIYSKKQIELIFTACRSYIPFITMRNKAIVALLLDTGIRRSEVCGIRLSDIKLNDSGHYLITVHGKGHKDRTVPLNTFAHNAVLAYKAVCPYDITDYLFLTKTGTPISPNTVSQAFTDIQAKLPFEFCAHKLRHNFATNFCINSIKESKFVDHLTLSLLLGHADISTTLRYEHLARELLIADSSYSFLDEAFLVAS